MNEEVEYALIEVKKLDVAVVFSERGMTEILEKIETKAKELEPDLSTDAGRKEIASMAYKVARSKTLLDDLGKGIIADWKEKVDNINKHRKTARDFLDILKEEVRKPLTDWEAEQDRIKAEKIRLEQKRVEGIRKKIEWFKAQIVTSPNTTAAQIETMINMVGSSEILPEVYQEFTEEATKTKETVYDALIMARKDRLAWEKAEAHRKAEAERLEKIRKEQEAEQKRLEAIQKEAAEKTRKEALKPDKERLLTYAHLLEVSIKPPPLDSERAITVLHDALRALKGIVAMIRKEAEKL